MARRRISRATVFFALLSLVLAAMLLWKSCPPGPPAPPGRPTPRPTAPRARVTPAPTRPTPSRSPAHTPAPAPPGVPRVALVIDDLVSVNPWTVRGMRIYGNAELLFRKGGQFGPGHYMRITPTVSWSWNLEGRPTTHDQKVVYRRAVHEAAAKPDA